MINAVVLDMGSSSIKVAKVCDEGTLQDILRAPSPPLKGSLLIQEGDAHRYYALAREVLEDTLAEVPNEVSIGIATQRSSFLLWNKDNGIPLTPLISWQDRRAHPWCLEKKNQRIDWSQITGLLLSPHYVGPKLSMLLQEDKELRQKADQGKLLCGTLETFFLWKISKGEFFQTDLTMASRTLMADPINACWSSTLLEHYKIPEHILPEIQSKAPFQIPFPGGGVITQTLADQSASLLGVRGGQKNQLLVNLGTGGFVLQPTGGKWEHLEGYLSGPLYPDSKGLSQYALEGTINSISTALDHYVAIEVELGKTDNFPESFCVPDSSGIGAPHWVSEGEFLLEMEKERTTIEERKQIVMEGIIFRTCEIIEDFWKVKGKTTPILSGGLIQEAFLPAGLAACLNHSVEISTEQETTLLGMASLVSENPIKVGTTSIELPLNQGNYLPEKFLKWKAWMKSKI